MEYISKLFQLFVLLFSQGSNFLLLIGLVITSGLVGGLVTLTKKFIFPARSNNE